MDCFHDFCLACDKTSVNGPYCSQACRLLDLEKANAESSPPASLRTSAHSRFASSTTTSTSTSTPGYTLSSAYHFAQQRDSYWMRSTTSKSSDSSIPRLLSPSSSRTSLSSTSSTTTTSPTGMSEQDRTSLQSYFASFDKVKAARRRSSLR